MHLTGRDFPSLPGARFANCPSGCPGCTKQARIVLPFLRKLREGDEHHMRVEAQDTGAFHVAIANALLTLWVLAGIQTRVVGAIAPTVVYLRLPLAVGIRLELADLVLLFGIVVGESADGAVHDVAGDTLDAAFEIVVILLVERTIIGVPVPNVREVQLGTRPDEMACWLEQHGFRVSVEYESKGDGSALVRLRHNLEQGIPTLVEWAELGGHWVVAVGYDTRGNA